MIVTQLVATRATTRLSSPSVGVMALEVDKPLLDTGREFPRSAAVERQVDIFNFSYARESFSKQSAL